MKNKFKFLISSISILFIILLLNENVKGMVMNNSVKPIKELTTYQENVNNETYSKRMISFD